MVAMHSPFDLLFPAAPGEDKPVKVTMATGFDVNRGLDDGDAVRFAGGEFREQALGTGADRRVDEVIQNLEPFGVGKHEFGQCLPVDPVFIIQDCWAEFLEDGGVGFAMRFEDLVAEEIGLNEEASEMFEGFADETFTGCEASG